jgi:4-nitrophenyl phosphatase
LKTENYKNVFIVGSDTLKAELSGLGINIVNDRTDNEVDAILIGMDLDFNYSKLALAYEVLQSNQRCKIIVSNVDPNFPVENGLRKPGCGAIVSSILTAANREYDFMVGKPDSFILTLIGKEKNISFENILVIGDSFDSDILMAKNANAHSILIDAFVNINTEKTITVKSINEIQEIFKKHYV